MMMLTKGDKLIVTKRVIGFLEEGDIVEITDTNENGLIAFAFGNGFMHKGLMSAAECEEHFTKYVEPTKEAPTVTAEHIKQIIDNSIIDVQTVFDKCTIVTCQLPNGFIIVESSACVSPENYDEDMGSDICMDRIINKVWELEGYRLQQEVYESKCGNCDECPCDRSCEDEDEDDDWLLYNKNR